jgi:CRISPR-associated endonuclease/helicase Cas3
MNVLLVSQCNGSALKETRRILDQFAERKGERTWQTDITQQGLVTLRKLLRQSARRNTAVCCHWIKKANYSEVIWIVGNRQRFNNTGSVPTNITRQNILRAESENNWHTLQLITFLSSIAGLFHDLGKANDLFQAKLKSNKKSKEPVRHEWVSLRLFQAFINGDNDTEWLTRLSTINDSTEKGLIENLSAYQDLPNAKPVSAIVDLPPLAQIIGWLIVSHHRLPEAPQNVAIAPDRTQHWLKKIDSRWNSTLPNELKKDDWQKVWTFSNNTPFASSKWRERAKKLAKRILKNLPLFENDKKINFNDRFCLHISRLALMLADHYYSAQAADKTKQDNSYTAFANTDKHGELKQKLDEHNIAVSEQAAKFVHNLPTLRQQLTRLSDIKALRKPTRHKKFLWQNWAYEATRTQQEKIQQQGFFGINMASTGCGKTFANARIMYALSNEATGCRFNIALGLRTLTLQTGDALRDKLNMASDEIAVLIGSKAVQDLHNNNAEEEIQTVANGSESAEPLYGTDDYVSYEGELKDNILNEWLKHRGKENKIIQAPILVSTIDHLIPATESTRGGKQIAPMLRLLTSDLVLDEPDDFSLEDLPALTRLVNWAGMLGSNVLLSSATLPPDFVHALFDAYSAGRECYRKSCLPYDTPKAIICGWFDEKSKPLMSECSALDAFKHQHRQFVHQRVKALMNDPVLRLAKLIDVKPASHNKSDVIKAMSSCIVQQIPSLHHAHHSVDLKSGKTLSIGLLRFANINPMIAIAKELLKISPPEDTRIHFCIYHSQQPLLLRSTLEKQLDSVLKRDPDNDQKFWKKTHIQKMLNFPEKNHILIVFATAVAEVGRDHDYDWAIAEPSSMRSLIQLAGRIQRHRQQQPSSENFLILNHNYLALLNKSCTYYRPGFETKDLNLQNKDLHHSLDENQFRNIRAIPRIQKDEQQIPTENLVALEHAQLYRTLYENNGHGYYASLWWQTDVTWCHKLQNEMRFRSSEKQEDYYYYFADEYDAPRWCKLGLDDKELIKVGDIESINFETAENIKPWFNADYEQLIGELAERNDAALDETCRRFGVISLREYPDNNDIAPWCFNPLLGIFREIKN